MTVLVTWFIARRLGLQFSDLEDLDAAMWSPDWLLLGVASAVLLGGNVLSGMLWGQVVADMSGVKLRPWDASRIFLVANLARYVPGKLWQLAGLAALAGSRGVPGRAATASAVVAHAMSLAAASVVGGMVFAGTDWGRSRGLEWVPVVIVAGVGVALLPPVFRSLKNSAIRLGLPEAILELRPATVLRWAALFILQWAVFGWAFYWLALSFHQPASMLGVSSAFVAAYVLGYVALFAPAGIGVREMALAGLLTPSMGAPAAAGLAVIARLWATLVEVIPAGLLWSGEMARSAKGGGGGV